MTAEINNLSTTDASNIARFPESQNPSTVNDGARALEGLLARGLKDTIDGALTTAGTSTAYTCTLNRSAVSAWYDGLTFTVKWNATCGASPTINPTGSAALGAKSLYWPNGTQVAASDLVSGGISILQYDGTNVQVLTKMAPFPLDINGLTADTGPDPFADYIPTYDNSATANKKALGADISIFGNQLLHVRDEKTQNTSGGGFTSGADRTRVLNTSKTNEISGASLASNQITLPAGTYFIHATAPAYSVGQHQAFLYNTSDSSEVLRGTCQFSSTTNPTMDRSVVSGRFTIAAQKVLELRHRCNTTSSSDGFGTPSNFSTEVYAEVMIWRVA